jgi:AraC-like DNA-binding protein
MSRTFDTREASAGERLEYWTQTVCDQIVPVQIDPRGTEQLAGTAMRSTGLGALQVRQVVGGEHIYVRGEREIRAGDPSTLQVGMQLTGSSLLIQDGREAVMGAGDIVLYDSSRPFSLIMDARFHWQVFLLLKEKLRRSDREIATLTAVPIHGSTGVAGVVARFLRDVAERSDELEADGSAAFLCENAADLVGTLVRSELGQQWAVRDPQRMLLESALAFMEAHLRDPSLAPERVAHAVNVSVRRLHQIFATTGRSVGEHIRDLRLAGVRRDLGDPRMSGLSIARVAAAHGWHNASAFSRQFRLTEGCTPTEFRIRALRRNV